MIRNKAKVIKSNKQTYLQISEANTGKVLFTFSDKGEEGKNKVERAAKMAEKVADTLISKKIKALVFDRNGYKYHGRVKAVAEGLRSKGVKI